GEVMPLRKVLEQVERDYPGEIIEVELEREDGAWVYEIKLIRKGGDVLELELDARDGSLRGIRGRDVRAAGQGAEAR
ncbi:MAG TPA: PepSY domain-containing protein, partial [Thauera sp.]|nr:PepSY domain-containing protein [Thauera sp.]